MNSLAKAEHRPEAALEPTDEGFVVEHDAGLLTPPKREGEYGRGVLARDERKRHLAPGEAKLGEDVRRPERGRQKQVERRGRERRRPWVAPVGDRRSVDEDDDVRQEQLHLCCTNGKQGGGGQRGISNRCGQGQERTTALFESFSKSASAESHLNLKRITKWKEGQSLA